MPLYEMSDNHRRGIGASLAFLDEVLCTLEQWAQGSPARGVLYEEHNSVLPQEWREIVAEIAAARLVLRELRETLGLTPKVQDVATSVWAWSWSVLEPLQELEGRYLRRYGEPPAELAEYLDPKIAELCGHMDAIRGIASRARARSVVTPPESR